MSNYMKCTCTHNHFLMIIRLLMAFNWISSSQSATSVTERSNIGFISNATTIAQALDQCLKMNLPCACLNLNIINFAAFPQNSISAYICHSGCISNKECSRTINNCDKSQQIPLCHFHTCRRECWCQCNTKSLLLSASASSSNNDSIDLNKQYYKCHLHNNKCRTPNKLEDSMWGVFGLITLIGSILSVVVIGHNFHRLKVVWNNHQAQSHQEVYDLINSTENPQNLQMHMQSSLPCRIAESSFSNNTIYQDTRLSTSLSSVDGPPSYAQATFNGILITQLKPIVFHGEVVVDLPSYEETFTLNDINNGTLQSSN